MGVKWNPLTGFFDLTGNSGGGGTLTGVTDSNSIDFSVSGGVNVTGDVKLSATPADSGYSLVDLNIETDGLRAEIANSIIKSAADNIQGPNTLLDNNSGTVLTYSAASYKFTFIDYSIERNGNYRCGRLLIANSAVSASIADAGYVDQGSVGVVFGVSVSGGNVQLQYTTTSSGFNGNFKYSIKQWS